MKKWTTIQLISVSSLGILTVVITLPATSLVAITGIPLMGGFINIFLDRTLDALALLLVPKFGSATVKRTVVGIVAIPTLLMGPPGFVAKVLISASNGLVVDIVYSLFKNKTLAIVISNGLAAVVFTFTFIYFGKLFGIPGIEETIEFFLSPLVLTASFLAGAFSGLAGLYIYQKLENTTLVKRIQTNE